MRVTKHLQTQHGELNLFRYGYSPAACQIDDGGAVSQDGTLYGNYSPMENMTEAAGFGGIRRVNQGMDNLNVGDFTDLRSKDYL